MNTAAESRTPGIRRFRSKLLVAMMLVVSTLTALGIFVAQRRAADDARADLQRDFELELASLHRLQDLRNAAVADRSKKLAQNARIHAALEDNALDLLYPSARDELRDVMERVDPNAPDRRRDPARPFLSFSRQPRRGHRAPEQRCGRTFA